MKKKYSRILGVALTLVLLVSLFGFATPVSAANVGWSGVVNPGNTLATGLNLADVEVGPIAVTPDGNTLFAAVNVEAALGIAGVSVPGRTWALLQSTDGGHNWAATGLRMNIGPITGIAISSNFATDGTMYVAAWSGALGTPAVFSTKNSGATFTEIKAVTAEAFAATPTTVINSIDMWPASPYPYVMVGTDTDVWVLQDAPFGIWRDQEVSAVGAVNIAAVAFAPDFRTTNYIWAVTAAGVVTTTNSPGAWGTILGNTPLPPTLGSLVAAVSADIGFPDGYSSTTTPYLWVGLNSGINTGGVWRIRGLPGVSQAIPQLLATDVRSIAVSGGMATATILAGLEHAATIRGSLNGGVTWMLPVFKQPTGGGVTYVVMAPDFATSNLAYVGTSDLVTLVTDGSGTAEWSTDYARTESYSVKLYSPGTADYGMVIMPLEMAFAADLDFSVYLNSATAMDLPMLGIELDPASVSAGIALPGAGTDVPADVTRIQITSQPLWATVGGFNTLQTDANPTTWELYGTTGAGTLPANGAVWNVWWAIGGATYTASYASGLGATYLTWAEIQTAFGGVATIQDVRVENRYPEGASTVYVDDITINGVTYNLEPDSSAFQVSGNAGMSWNQTGLIDTPFTAINDVAVVSLDTIFMVTDNYSLWKTTDATATAPVWERILTSATVVAPFNALTAAGTIDFVETSPDFLTDGVVYAANNGTGIMKSTDGGNIFAPMGPPGAAITALHVVDATFAFTGAVSNVYRTDDGAYSWLAAVTGTAPVGTVVSIATSPDYATDGTVLVGTDSGTVYRSAMTRGATFAQAGGTGATIAAGVTNTYVAFDPGYATNSTVYAGGNAIIARYNFALPTVPWTPIDLTMPTGVAVSGVAGDTFAILGSALGPDTGIITVTTGTISVTTTGAATYVGTATGGSYTVPGSGDSVRVTATATTVATTGTWASTTGFAVAAITVDADGDATVSLGAGAFSLPDPGVAAAAGASTINGLVTSPDGTLYGSNLLLAQGMERSLNPTASTTAPVEGWIAPVFERASALAGLATFNGLWLRVDETLDVVGSKNVLFSINTTANQIMTYTDTLAAPVVSLAPEDGAVFPREAEVTLEWEALTGARSYHWQIARDARFSIGLIQDVSGYTTDTSALLGAGRTYYWRVRVASVASVIAPAGNPVLSRWSETRTFTTLLGERPWHPFSNMDGVAPGPGASDVLTTPTFQWNGADWATSYQLMLADNAAFTGATTKTLTTTSWVSDTDLGYSTTWYWKVIALSATSESEWSDVGVFTTMAEPAPPVVVEEVQPPVIEVIIPEQPAAVEVTPVSPGYLLAIIIIGAVLVIFVIVLIVRTRRPI